MVSLLTSSLYSQEDQLDPLWKQNFLVLEKIIQFGESATHDRLGR